MESRDEFLESYDCTEQDIKSDVTGEYIWGHTERGREKVYLPSVEDVDDDEVDQKEDDYE